MRAKILVIDDAPGVRMTVQYMLQDLNHEVVTAENGRQGLECLEAANASFDLVISDVVMPVMNGIELMKQITARGIKIPVMAMSGGGDVYSTEDALVAAAKLADKTLRKPFTQEELMKVVNFFLNKQKIA